MSKAVAIADLYPVMEEMLRNGGCVTLVASGVSMLPMLRHQQDTVILGPVTSSPHVNDVVLYRRESGQFVLHRIVGLESNGDYVLCGDNQFVLEHHITRHQVVGRLREFTRKGHRISCDSLLYKTFVCLLPLMRFSKRGTNTIRRYTAAVKRKIRRLMSRNG